MMYHSLASEFLSLLQFWNLSNEEVKMADNYFPVLKNHPPETWFDQGIEFGGGQAFTVGSEGHERNKKHILRACHYLDTVLGSEIPRARGGIFAPTQGWQRAWVGLAYSKPLFLYFRMRLNTLANVLKICWM
ncbi:hypothetical protein EDB92DRAFT_1393666 [Lactarius akahatsu]|uniref:Uncharacterized protein n=1 Tax=Lactarius akahatsu TaxID=416441 RepID=A0AAD4QG93_9AGAM|nr:hypothetical protein EDB92DRAFT_1393666 [Lactarius akahatsu]